MDGEKKMRSKKQPEAQGAGEDAATYRCSSCVSEDLWP